jgi:hypothetical protein
MVSDIRSRWGFQPSNYLLACLVSDGHLGHASCEVCYCFLPA